MQENGRVSFIVQIGPLGYRELTTRGTYTNRRWRQQRKDRSQGDVRAGDLIFFYFTGRVRDCPRRIERVFRVTAVAEDNEVLFLEEVAHLREPLVLESIRSLVSRGTLGWQIGMAGQQGFNIYPMRKNDAAWVLRSCGTNVPTLPV